jgi:hypothetical protein
MYKVSGIGGFFFCAKDPDALAARYSDNLGIVPVPGPGSGSRVRKARRRLIG